MQTAVGVKIAVAIIFLLIYIIRKAAGPSTPVNKSFQKPPQNNSNPFQQNQPPANQNPFQQQNSAKPNYQDTFTSAENFNPMGNNPQAASTSVYCMYCGKKFTNASLLAMDTCFKHPNSEAGLQKHVLYRGMGKPNVGM